MNREKPDTRLEQAEQSPAESGPESEKEARNHYWHMGFYGGMELELAPWRERLTFIHEYQLTKKSLILDMLVIQMSPGTVIDDDIWGYLKGHNLFEFKSVTDRLSVDKFFKSLSTPYLYKSQGKTANEIEMSDVTLTILCFHYPNTLFSELSANGIVITEESSGMYRLDGFFSLSVHIVVIPRLPRGTHLPLRLLRTKADFGEFLRFMDRAASLDESERHNLEALVHIVTQANPEFVKRLSKEGLSMSMELDDETLHASMRRVFAVFFDAEEERIRRETAEQVRRETTERVVRETDEKNQSNFITRMLQNHAPMNLIEACTMAPAEKIMEIARSIGVTPVM